MLLIGLTGSIATGKSTVSAMLAAPPHNLPIIDADLLARQVVAPGTRGHAAIVARFGASTPGLVTPSGALDRSVLGRRVFGSEQDRRALNGIVHPLVRREMYKAIAKHYLAGQWACVLDVPLLFESSLDLLCGTVLVVAVRRPQEQLARLLARDAHLTRADAEQRVSSQMAACEQTARARAVHGGFVLDNDGSVEDLRARVADVVRCLRGASGAGWWWCGLMRAVPPLAGAVAAVVVLRNWWRRRRWVQAREREKARL